jgi:SAM-dependent methyltransferase
MKPDYGIDSPGIVAGHLIMGLLALVAAYLKPHVRWIAVAAAVYFIHGAVSMIDYSKRGKLKLRETLLDMIPWRGDETVLDVGCGKGLLVGGAARRLTTGKAIGVDVWVPHAMTGNRLEAVHDNMRLEGVSDRVEVKRADARELPFEDGTFDVVVSNFVVHEMSTRADRVKMLREMMRVLKPGGRLALTDFIFTKECAEVCDGVRTRIGGLRFWVGAVLTLGSFQLYAVTARKG